MGTDSPVEEINLDQYWLVLKRRWKPAVAAFGLISLLSVLFVASKDTVYEAQGKLLFKTDRSPSLTGVGETLGRLEALEFQANPLNTQVEIIQSIPILEAVIQDLDLKHEDGSPFTLRDIYQGLSVSPVPGTDVLRVSYQSGDPELAALIVNQIANVFIRENIQENRAEAIAARDFISQQLPKTEAALNLAEMNLQDFKERNQVVELQQEASSLVDITFDLQRQIDEVQSRISSIDTTLSVYQNQLNIRDPEFAIVLAALNQSEGVQQVLREIQNLEAEIGSSRALFTSESQAIRRLDAKRQNLQEILRQRTEQVVNNRPFLEDANLQIGGLQTELISEIVALDAQRQGLGNQINVLSEQINTYGQRMGALPQLEKQQSELERELEVAQTTYQTLLGRFQELQVAESQNIGNARLISSAVPPEHPLPQNRKIVLAGGVFSGALVGIALAFLLDMMDKSVKSVKEARQLFGYTLLGVVPAMSLPEEATLYAHQERWIPSVITQKLPHSPISEAYRMLQANLKFLNSDKPLKTIAITSSVPKEGKSEVAANLALTIAQAGRKVLLVDANLRQPVQHRIWDLPNSSGLSNLLVDQLDPQETVKTVIPNLDILLAGVIPPNPVALIDSKSMAALVTDLEDSYDFIVFDTPPLLGTADASVLGKLLGGVLLVVSPGIVDSVKARSTKELLFQANQNVLGMVLNNVDVKNEPDSYYHYNDCNTELKNTSITKSKTFA